MCFSNSCITCKWPWLQVEAARIHLKSSDIFWLLNTNILFSIIIDMYHNHVLWVDTVRHKNQWCPPRTLCGLQPGSEFWKLPRVWDVHCLNQLPTLLQLNTSSKAKPNQRYCINYTLCANIELTTSHCNCKSLPLCFLNTFVFRTTFHQRSANSKSLPESQDNLLCSPKSISINLSFLTKCSLVFLRQRPHPLISKFSHSCAS